MRKLIPQLALVMALAANPAIAQAVGNEQTQPLPGDEGQATIEDIVVTAQRREQRLQDVPLAVSAVSAEGLERKGIKGMGDLSQTVPGLLFNKSTATVTPFLRGVGNPSVTPGSDPSVATYIDGVYQASPNGLIFGFNNIERVEVLKGPQGTLFGRNSAGGIIQIVTRDPKTDPTVNIKIGVARFDTVEGSAYLSGGIGRVAADLSVLYTKQAGGWGRNRFTSDQAGTVLVNGQQVVVPEPSEKDAGLNEELSIRSKFVIEASDNFTVKLVGQYSWSDSDQGFYLDHLYGRNALITQGGTSVPYTKTSGFYDFNQNVRPTSRNRQYQLSADLTYDFGPALVRSISAYTDAKSTNTLQSSAQPMVDDTAQVSQFNIPTKAFSQELQFLSKPGQSFGWLIGLYYFNWKTGYLPLVFVRGPSLDGGINRIASLNTRSKAMFAQATYELGLRTRLTAGVRYTNDTVTSGQTYVGTTLSTIPAPAAASVNMVRSNVVPEVQDRFGNISFRAALDHHIADDVMLYASINRGYKGGTFNTGSLCLVNVIGFCPTASYAASVKPEILLAYEGGLKSELFGRRLRLNIAGFYYDYANLQVQTLTGTPLVSRLANAASARLYGADVDFEAAVTANFHVAGGFELLNAKYTDFPGASVNVPRAGAPYGNATVVLANAAGRYLNRAPKFSGNIGGNLLIPTPLGEIRLNANYYYNGGFYWDVTNRLKEHSYGLLNLDVGLALNDNWSFKIWGRNIAGEKYYTYVSASNYGDRGSPGAPFTFGATIGWQM